MKKFVFKSLSLKVHGPRRSICTRRWKVLGSPTCRLQAAGCRHRCPCLQALAHVSRICSRLYFDSMFTCNDSESIIIKLMVSLSQFSLTRTTYVPNPHKVHFSEFLAKFSRKKTRKFTYVPVERKGKKMGGGNRGKTFSRGILTRRRRGGGNWSAVCKTRTSFNLRHN